MKLFVIIIAVLISMMSTKIAAENDDSLPIPSSDQVKLFEKLITCAIKANAEFESLDEDKKEEIIKTCHSSIDN
uniref:Secreted protein n=1 Tax=Parastrongyloides trichosuri TaxID=131310 RepID=A0A0N4ZQH8_PARTI